ncbi:Oxysterol-binding protein [Nowakowskiella sp. JEL0407]|nr:Oxysterol-binding protein [Nowakowskiella sp. JEL0407]
MPTYPILIPTALLLISSYIILQSKALMSFIIVYISSAIAFYLWFPAIVSIAHGFLKEKANHDIILVTGGSHGIGRELVNQLLDLYSDSKIVVWDVRALDLIHDRVFFYACDVGSYEKVKRAAEQTMQDIGIPTLIINNAGITIGKEVKDMESEEIIRLFSTNTLSNYFVTKEFLPYLLKKDFGHIVSVASLLAFSGATKSADYCASKAAISLFAESLRQELLHTNIKVSCIYPGLTKTGLFQKVHIPYPFLFPTLTTQDLVSKIISHIKINKSGNVCFPTFVNLAWVNFGLPIEIGDLVRYFAGSNKSMNKFAGSKISIEKSPLKVAIKPLPQLKSIVIVNPSTPSPSDDHAKLDIPTKFSPPHSRSTSLGNLRGSASTSEISLNSKSVDEGIQRRSSTKEQGGIAGKKKSKLEIDPDLKELLPMCHYESSKYNIKGSFICFDIRQFILRKLTFFVSIRDSLPSLPTLKTITTEGWILKKGDRNFQGYAKRWLKIDGEGYLTYMKQSDSYQRGSAYLPNAVVRADHDHLLIDVDSDESLLHFKALSVEDFRMWIATIEKFANSKQDQLIEHPIVSPRRQSIDGVEVLPHITSEEDLLTLKRNINSTIDNIAKDMRIIADKVNSATSECECQISPDLKFLNTITQATQSNISFLQSQLDKCDRSQTRYQSHLQAELERSESAFKKCFLELNTMREQNGLEAFSAQQFYFLPNLYFGGSKNWDDTQSFVSEYFDAEEGEEDGDSVDDEDELESLSDSDGGPVGTLESKSRGESISGEKKVLVETEIVTNGTFSRRKVLPAPATSLANVSFLSIFRNNIGKDLSTVTMPIIMNEPLNLLQRLAEELDYCDLLEKANKSTNSIERLTYITAFAISGYAPTAHRAARKPFNPLLGETYECIREDRGFRFISEKVSHQPPVMVCHAEGNGFTFYQDSMIKSKFWGKSLEFTPYGTVNVVLRDHKEHYSWKKVTSCMKNVIAGTRYLEYYGQFEITNEKTGEKSVVTFKESGFFTSNKNEVNGAVFSADGTKLINISGKWDEQICTFADQSPNQLDVIWRVTSNPLGNEMYGFTPFSVELNEMTPDLIGKIPNTDTRLRLDQQLYEKGELELAENEKLRLEQRQRERRKTISWKPRFFEHIDVGGEEVWMYKEGSYWENRGNIPDVDLFGE